MRHVAELVLQIALKAKSRMKNRFILLITILVVAATGWTVAWQYFSREAGQAFAKAVEKANDADQRVTCANQRTDGFPFRLAIRCDKPLFAKGDDFEIEAAAMHAQAFVYRPTHQVVDFKSPAQIKAGNLGTLELVWEKARLGSRLDTTGLSAATAKIERARMSLLNPPLELANTALLAEKVTVSARKAADGEAVNSLALGLISSGLEVEGAQYTLPKLSLEASVLAFDIASVLDGHATPFRLWIAKGGEADIRGIRIESGEAKLFTKGWVKLDRDGFISADLDVDSANLDDFIASLGPELAQFQAIGAGLVGVIGQLGADSKIDDTPAKRVKLVIKRGFVSVGLLPLGTIAPLDLSRI